MTPQEYYHGHYYHQVEATHSEAMQKILRSLSAGQKHNIEMF